MRGFLKALTYSLHIPVSSFKWQNTILLKIYRGNTPCQYLRYQETGCELYFFVFLIKIILSVAEKEILSCSFAGSAGSRYVIQYHATAATASKPFLWKLGFNTHLNFFSVVFLPPIKFLTTGSYQLLRDSFWLGVGEATLNLLDALDTQTHGFLTQRKL